MCHSEDTGGQTGQENCIGCIQNACPGGANDYFKYLQNCLCGSGPCATACGGSNDYCVYLGCNPNTGCSNSCSNCIDTYTASGKACDPTTGSIAACCAADANCNSYITDSSSACP